MRIPRTQRRCYSGLPVALKENHERKAKCKWPDSASFVDKDAKNPSTSLTPLAISASSRCPRVRTESARLARAPASSRQIDLGCRTLAAFARLRVFDLPHFFAHGLMRRLTA